MAFIIRPHDFFLFSLFVIMAFIMLKKNMRFALFQKAFRLIPGFIIPTAFLCIWHYKIYGTALTPGYGFAVPGALEPGIHVTFGFSLEHTLKDAVIRSIWSFYKLNNALLGWSISLLFIPFALLDRKSVRANTVCLIVTAAVAFFYFFYSYYGHEYECRFYYLTVPFLLCLTVRGIFIFRHMCAKARLTQFMGIYDMHAATGLVAGIIMVLFVHGFSVYWPKVIWPKYGTEYEGAYPVVHQTVKRAGITKGLVMIPSSGKNYFRYSSGFIYNDPGLTDNVLYVRDIPSSYTCLRKHFPDYPFYRFIPSPSWKKGEVTPVQLNH
jgi:hypothetical protein